MQCTRLPFMTTAEPRAHSEYPRHVICQGHGESCGKVISRTASGDIEVLKDYCKYSRFPRTTAGTFTCFDFYILKIDFHYLKSGSRKAK